MKPTVDAPRRLRPSRRGITLVEMLVTVAVLVLLMTMLVQIFQGATGSLSAAQSFQELDNSLRRLDTTIRSDLDGVTARLTPPLNPKDGLGYFEYGENAFADLQGEDSDDYVRFTAKAPPGRPFLGRMLVPPPFDPSNMTTGPGSQLNRYINDQPVLITSDYAEIIYFVRNGNLYRRVLLIAPERQSSIVQMSNNLGFAGGIPFTPGAYGGNFGVSWQGMNDLSARPAASGPSDGSAVSKIVLNTLGDLTNRENRFAYPRFSNDYLVNGTNAGPPDGIADDTNGDGVPDFYPTLYTNSASAFTTQLTNLLATAVLSTNYALPSGGGFSSMAFPYIFPGAYSQPETSANAAWLGWIHSPTPIQLNYPISSADMLTYLQQLNHNPLDVGDNLYRPQTGNNTFQSWWGFPTWRETLSFSWADPTLQLNLNNIGPIPPTYPQVGGLQGLGLNSRNPNNGGGTLLKVFNDIELLPPMIDGVRANPQLYTDSFGANGPSQIYSQYDYNTTTNGPTFELWNSIGEPDLILTGVRSFDIKVYDQLYAGYVDLGWKNDLRISGNLFEYNLGTDNTNNAVNAGAYNFLNGTPSTAYSPFAGAMVNPAPFSTAQAYLLPTPTAYTPPPPAQLPEAAWMPTMATFGHEGRMPPLTTDNRADAQFPNGYYSNPTYSGYPVAPNDLGHVIANIGDDAPNVNRLRRVFDTWSTDYTAAPAHAINPTTGGVVGPPYAPPVYPSYPPPYPAPLKGIQIQVRVVDPTNQRIKQITIRHDFTDRL